MGAASSAVHRIPVNLIKYSSRSRTMQNLLGKLFHSSFSLKTITTIVLFGLPLCRLLGFFLSHVSIILSNFYELLTHIHVVVICFCFALPGPPLPGLTRPHLEAFPLPPPGKERKIIFNVFPPHPRVPPPHTLSSLSFFPHQGLVENFHHPKVACLSLIG